MDEAGNQNEFNNFKDKIRYIMTEVSNLIAQSKLPLDEYSIKINNENEQLKDYKNNKIKEIDEKIQQYQKYIENIEIKIEGLNGDRKIYEEVIIQLNNEIEDLKFKIENQTSTVAVFVDVFNHLYNPMGAVESDKVIELTETLNDLTVKSTENLIEAKKKINQISKLVEKQSQLDSILFDFNKEKSQLIKLIYEKEIVIEQLKSQKKDTESRICNLESFLGECNVILEKCESNGPSSINDISIQLNSLYHSYNLNI